MVFEALKGTAIATLATLGIGSGLLWAGVDSWTSLGPDGGGASALILDPKNPDTVYAVTPAGLFKTTDGGAGWGPTTPLPPNSGVITSLTIDPQNPSTLYAATRDASSGDLRLDGVFKSTDGGTSWRALKSGLLFGLSAPLAVDPQNPSIIYAGSYNDIFKSTDGGATWKTSGSGLPASCCVILRSFSIDPRNSNHVYAVTGLGIFQSINQGASWRAVYLYSHPFSDPQFTAMTMDPQDSSTLYGLAAGPVSGIFKSTDGAASWNAVNSGLPPTPNGAFHVISLVIDPQDSSTAYAGTWSGLFKTTDGGVSWNAAPPGLTTPGIAPIGALAINAQNSKTIYASSTGPQAGVYKTTDGAANWSAINSGLRAISISRLTNDPQNPATLYANAGDGIFKTDDGGINWNHTTGVYLLAIDPQNAATLFGTRVGSLSKSTDAGASWSPANVGLPEGQGVASLTVDPRNSSTVYAGLASSDPGSGGRNGGVWKSSDGGATWAKLDAQPGGGGVRGFAIDPQDSSTLYAWNGMGLFRGADGGASWSKLRAGPVNSLVIDPQNPATLYAVLNDESIVFLTGEKPGIYKSSDGGASWSAVNAGLPTIYLNLLRTDNVLSLVIDRNGTLYAGIEGNGVFRSADGGSSWSSMNSGLTTLSVYTLSIGGLDFGTVYAGTAGGVFVMKPSPQ